MARVLWTPSARDDLLNIYVTIGRESPSAAERIFDRLERRAMQLAAQ